MAGGFYMPDGFSNGQSFGQVTSTSLLTNVTAGAANTKGAYTQLLASTPYDITLLTLASTGASTTGSASAVDIAVGASGSEQVIISNVQIGSPTVYATGTVTFPVAIPAGSRIAARSQASTASDTPSIGILAFDNSAVGRNGAIIDCLGLVSTTSLGAAIDAGATANTKGAYVQITAATTYDYAGFAVHFDGQSVVYAANANALVDVAVGASGSEKNIISNHYIRLCGQGNIMPEWSHWIDMPIRAGSRIAVRSQCSSATSTNRVVGFTFYGLRG